VKFPLFSFCRTHVLRSVGERSSNGTLYFDDSGFARVGVADPLEGSAEEAVAFFAGDYVNVQVGDALGDFDVGGDDGAVGVHRLFDGYRQALNRKKVWPHLGRGEIAEGFIVRLRHYKYVARQERVMV
jgi:hypothetical protein